MKTNQAKPMAGVSNGLVNTRELNSDLSYLKPPLFNISHQIHILNDRYLRAELSIIDIFNLFCNYVEANQGPNYTVLNMEL